MRSNSGMILNQPRMQTKLFFISYQRLLNLWGVCGKNSKFSTTTNKTNRSHWRVSTFLTIPCPIHFDSILWKPYNNQNTMEKKDKNMNGSTSYDLNLEVLVQVPLFQFRTTEIHFLRKPLIIGFACTTLYLWSVLLINHKHLFWAIKSKSGIIIHSNSFSKLIDNINNDFIFLLGLSGIWRNYQHWKQWESAMYNCQRRKHE